ncbi:unnamed protein product [Pseudo-nitzschia multistriata]|uniref:beta-N-acetylhexosaminidase n=1 Tax=Pseudo-nitzschia multistriata TaxID=183589 RepID=A0A448YYJ7_9STRA|nr:unnamed protein product [Pseudo-nitzschia multistriata]
MRNVYGGSLVRSSRGYGFKRKQRAFRTFCIFQLLGSLVCSGLLMSLWLMAQLEETLKSNIATPDKMGKLQRPKEPFKRTTSNDFLAYDYERKSSRQAMHHPPETEQMKSLVGNPGSHPSIEENTNGSVINQITWRQRNQLISSPSPLFPLLPPSLDYLGVLIDAGRHYFPVPWLYQHLRYLHDLGYNYIHFRLTDDQNFILNITIPKLGIERRNRSISDTSFAFVARWEQEQKNLHGTHNGTADEGDRHVYYQPHELSKFVEFARDEYNITVVPEINVPGHAGAWGANTAVPDLVVSCPKFACSNGYGVPLNLTHPELPKILEHVLTEVVEIFHHPPFLHLGGDELHMSLPCLEEAGIADTSSWLSDSVARFEKETLGPIVEGLGYGPHQILRWETPNQKRRSEPEEYRFGGITHYWESTPPSQNDGRGDVTPYMVSTGLYLDVMSTSKIYGYGDFLAAQKLVSEARSNPPFAIVAGAFELGTEFWEDRNVLGRLFAIRMGVATASETPSEAIPRTQYEFKSQYLSKCKSIFHFSNADSICESAGLPLLEDRSYQAKWKLFWKEWKTGLCEGLTYPEQSPHIHPSSVDPKVQRTANHNFWESVLSSSQSLGVTRQHIHTNVTAPKSIDSNIPHVGLVVNLVENSISQQNLFRLLQTIELLGMNLIQLNLADDFGQVVEYDSVSGIGYSTALSEANQKDAKIALPLYDRHRLEQIIGWAYQAGIQLVPEINLATNGGGWFKTGMLIDCPKVLCEKGHGIAFDVINKIESVLPIVLSVVAELRDIFSASPLNKFMHLGFDEREMAVGGCFSESGLDASEVHAALHRFETKLFDAISLIGADHHNIIRWQNEEKVEYRDRTGKITQFTSIDDLADKYDSISDLTPFFGTVLITEKNTPWEVYQATLCWTTKSSPPHGLVAKGTHGQVPQIDQLVAFTMGLRDRAKTDTTFDGFQTDFAVACEKLRCREAAQYFGRTANNRAQLKDLNLRESCIERTTNTTSRRSKK